MKILAIGWNGFTARAGVELSTMLEATADSLHAITCCFLLIFINFLRGDLPMTFSIYQHGLFVRLSTDNKLYLQVEKYLLTHNTLEKYYKYVKGHFLIFTYNFSLQESALDLVLQNKSQQNKKTVELITEAEITSAFLNANTNSIIYTGAGLSRAAGIKTSKELYDTLLINGSLDYLVSTYIERPKDVLAQFTMFCLRLYISQPTVAHFKIAQLISKTNCILVSENLDILHQKSGAKPHNPFEETEMLKRLSPDKVFLLGIGYPMCSILFDYWNATGATFYSVNHTFHELNIPLKLHINDLQYFFDRIDI